ncbi:peptidoglycan-binding protein [Pedobacter sp. MC2016-14]|uniref:peptidoglycan-binding protein n=1 Tax=Pedobacter sp. MC2016-14 TaxID=2897327 RepID=UPI001E362B77|nr:peptidoglycan-binding protein [Pedobacter sp. MC2016-14]MCD0490559.1 peptidoglycan-binding protein [Pedobacter sp. MC2016-14]
MAAAKFLFCIVCAAVAGSGWMPDRNLLIGSSARIALTSSRTEGRDLIVKLALNEIGVHEYSNRNDGKRVAEYQHAGNCRKGDPWCACFCSWVYQQAGYPGPRTGWSPDLFPARRLRKKAMPADLYGIYFPALGRIAHCGILTKLSGDWCTGIEGNTNPGGSREGDGVYRRMRHKRSISRFADWTIK